MYRVTPSMRREVLRRMQERGVAMADSVFTGGERVVGEQLGFEIARYRFGPAAERRRRLAGDDQVQRAVELLRQSTTPQALLGMAPPAANRPH